MQLGAWTISRDPAGGMTVAIQRCAGHCIRAAAVLALLTVTAAAGAKQPFRIEDVATLTARPIDRLPAQTILFSDRFEGKPADPRTGLIAFEDWVRTRPDETQSLNLYPGYSEPVVKRTVVGVTRTRTEKLTMYVGAARFKLHWRPAAADIARFATLAFVRQVDPSIKNRLIRPDEITPLSNEKFAHNRNPLRPWCSGPVVICLRSHYRLEGKLPLAVHLVNKLREAGKQIADTIEFESELAARAPDDVDLAAVQRLTGLDAPVVGTLEQTTFYVNQVLDFAKFLIVFQPDPSDPNATVTTAFMALAVDSKMLNVKRDYARVPVLRNLVPVQVLMGQSSFNTGTSISSGLPNYARSRVKAVARILDAGPAG